MLHGLKVYSFIICVAAWKSLAGTVYKKQFPDRLHHSLIYFSCLFSESHKDIKFSWHNNLQLNGDWIVNNGGDITVFVEWDYANGMELLHSPTSTMRHSAAPQFQVWNAFWSGDHTCSMSSSNCFCARIASGSNSWVASYRSGINELLNL